MLPCRESEKGLADRFVDFVVNKISKIEDGFSGTCEYVIPPKSTPPPFREFKKISEEDICKLIIDTPTKLCSLDPYRCKRLY